MRHLATCAAALLASTVALSADVKGDWAKSFERKTATIKVDLPAFIPSRIGVLALTPDRGTLYAFGAVMDRTPEQLLTKLQVDNARGKSVTWRTGWAEPAKLVYLKAGAPVTIHSVTISNERIMVRLWDEFDRQRPFSQPPSTGFQIILPAKVSNAFTERAVIDGLIGQVLDWP